MVRGNRRCFNCGLQSWLCDRLPLGNPPGRAINGRVRHLSMWKQNFSRGRIIRCVLAHNSVHFPRKAKENQETYLKMSFQDMDYSLPSWSWSLPPSWVPFEHFADSHCRYPSFSHPDETKTRKWEMSRLLPFPLWCPCNSKEEVKAASLDIAGPRCWRKAFILPFRPTHLANMRRTHQSPFMT